MLKKFELKILIIVIVVLSNALIVTVGLIAFYKNIESQEISEKWWQLFKHKITKYYFEVKLAEYKKILNGNLDKNLDKVKTNEEKNPNNQLVYYKSELKKICYLNDKKMKPRTRNEKILFAKNNINGIPNEKEKKIKHKIVLKSDDFDYDILPDDIHRDFDIAVENEDFEKPINVAKGDYLSNKEKIIGQKGCYRIIIGPFNDENILTDCHKKLWAQGLMSEPQDKKRLLYTINHDCFKQLQKNISIIEKLGYNYHVYRIE